MLWGLVIRSGCPSQVLWVQNRWWASKKAYGTERLGAGGGGHSGRRAPGTLVAVEAVARREGGQWPK